MRGVFGVFVDVPCVFFCNFLRFGFRNPFSGANSVFVVAL